MLARLDARKEGLSHAEARARSARVGPNSLPVAEGPSPAALLLRQLKSPLLYALLASAAVAFAFGQWEDGAVVLAVVVLNALIGFAQELRAGQAIAALSRLVADPARVRRDGAWVELPAEEVVPGDVLAVAEGERVPADCGSCARRTADAGGRPDGGVEPRREADRAGARLGTACRAPQPRARRHRGGGGRRRGRRGRHGPTTELGRISALLEQTDVFRTPLTRELDRSETPSRWRSPRRPS